MGLGRNVKDRYGNQCQYIWILYIDLWIIVFNGLQKEYSEYVRGKKDRLGYLYFVYVCIQINEYIN